MHYAGSTSTVNKEAQIAVKQNFSKPINMGLVLKGLNVSCRKKMCT